MEDAELKKAVETLLFIADQPVPLARLAQILGEEGARVETAVRAIEAECAGRGVQVLEIAGGFQLATRSAYAPFVRKLHADKLVMRLSNAALETLAIIAYKQPITRAEIEEVRGVEVIAALETLLDKRLVKVAGRREAIGRPLLYGTTPDFLRQFGLKSLEELPPIESFPAEPPASPPAEAAAVPAAEPAAASAATERYREGVPPPRVVGARPTEPEGLSSDPVS